MLTTWEMPCVWLHRLGCLLLCAGLGCVNRMDGCLLAGWGYILLGRDWSSCQVHPTTTAKSSSEIETILRTVDVESITRYV